MNMVANIIARYLILRSRKLNKHVRYRPPRFLRRAVSDALAWRANVCRGDMYYSSSWFDSNNQRIYWKWQVTLE